MATVGEILARKGGRIHTVELSSTALEAIYRMDEERVGALVVTDRGRVLGMFTERDVLRRIVAEQRSPALVSVSEAMTPEVICCMPETTLDEVSRIMGHQRIRHLPVCDDTGKLLGMVSIGDVMRPPRQRPGSDDPLPGKRTFLRSCLTRVVEG